LATSEQSSTAAVRAERSPLRSSTLVLVVRGRVDRHDVSRLCERVHDVLAAGDADLVVCDVGGVVGADAVTVDLLARLQLAARRLGMAVRLRRASNELQDLLVFFGLRDVARWD
jgi:ABC-type transporter Mla MlaB component